MIDTFRPGYGQGQLGHVYMTHFLRGLIFLYYIQQSTIRSKCKGMKIVQSPDLTPLTDHDWSSTHSPRDDTKQIGEKRINDHLRSTEGV